MVNYFNSYKNFIDSHKIKDKELIKIAHNKHLKMFERHHVYPVCLDGSAKNRNNYVYLSEYDHCIAHILFDLSMIQKGNRPTGYSVRDVFYRYQGDNAKYWKTISNIKVNVRHDNKKMEYTLTLNKALNLIASGRENEKCRNAARNKIMGKILCRKFSNCNKKINGFSIDFCF